VAALVAGVGLFASRDNFHPVIEGRYYRSAQLSGPRLTELIRAHQIRSVINLRPVRGDPDWHDDEIEAIDALGIDHHSVGMYQSSPRVDEILALNRVLDQAQLPTLFHCASGVDRTGLASVMVLLKEGEQVLDEIARQVSWRYGVIADDSVGKVFLREYRQWLEENDSQHSPEVFDHWLHEEFVDPTGNVHFLVHEIHGQTWFRPFGRYAEGVKFEVSRSETDQLIMTGWAFDTRNETLLAGLSLRLDDTPLPDVRYGIPSPWLLDEFGKEQWVDSGWAVQHPLADLPDGCADLFITFERLDGSTWESPPAARICITPG